MIRAAAVTTLLRFARERDAAGDYDAADRAYVIAQRFNDNFGPAGWNTGQTPSDPAAAFQSGMTPDDLGTMFGGSSTPGSSSPRPFSGPIKPFNNGSGSSSPSGTGNVPVSPIRPPVRPGIGIGDTSRTNLSPESPLAAGSPFAGVQGGDTSHPVGVPLETEGADHAFGALEPHETQGATDAVAPDPLGFDDPISSVPMTTPDHLMRGFAHEYGRFERFARALSRRESPPAP